MRIFWFRFFIPLLSAFFCFSQIHAAAPNAKSHKKVFIPFVQLNKEAIELMKKVNGYWVEVQVPQRRLLLAKGGHLIKSFSIAVGEPTYPTPIGERKINTVIWNPWWYPPPHSKWVTDPTPIQPRVAENPLGEIKMPLGDNYLIHGTRAVDSIGRWASHGCIRMLFEDLFSVVQILMTEYSDLSAIDAMEKANQDTLTQFHTSLNRSIPVVLTYIPVQVEGEMIQISPDIYGQIPDMAQIVVNVLEPHLSKEQSPNLRKIDLALKQLKQETLQFQIKSITANVDDRTAEEGDKAYLEEKQKKEEKNKAKEALAEERRLASEEKEEEKKQKAQEKAELQIKKEKEKSSTVVTKKKETKKVDEKKSKKQKKQEIKKVRKEIKDDEE